MTIDILKAADFKTTKWAGGSTTELLIHPRTANYTTGDFNFRISSATVEVEESNFTMLPGVSRQLMVLSGSITLSHKDYEQLRLNKSDVAIFDGSWKTSAVGICVDFNLMTKGKTKGKISSISVSADKSLNFKLDSSCEFIIFYAYEGNLKCHFSSEKRSLNMGELMVIQNPLNDVIKLKGSENCALAVVHIYK